MRVINNIRLTDNQGRVLARILISPTPQVAASEISQGQNMVAARNELMSFGLITLTNGAAEITDKGMTIATQENIVDDTGELTDKGQELAFTDTDGERDEDTASSTTPPPMESYRTGKMLKEIYLFAFPKK